MNTTGIIGHKHQIKKLEYMLNSSTLPQAMLFYGTQGTGKKQIALRILNALFCEDSNPPCLECPICLQFKNETYPDFFGLYPNEKGIIPIGNQEKKEYGSVRWLIERLSKRSIHGKYGVIIDGVDKISNEGEVALLKTIEEPAIGTHIILIVENKSEILPTILSRCMEISFSPLKDAEIKEILGKNGITDPNIDLFSKISAGSIQIAHKLTDNNIFEEIIDLSIEITEYIEEKRFLNLNIVNLQKKIPIDNLITILINIYRTILIARIKGLEVHPALIKTALDDPEKLSKLIKIFLALRKGLANNLNIRSSLKGMLNSIDQIHNIDINGFNLT